VPSFADANTTGKSSCSSSAPEIDEQVEHLVDDRLGAVAGPIDLVHDEQRSQAVRQRLADHEARLRHHAVDRVDHEQHRVDHREHALHLAAEVGVAGRVDEMDAHALELDARVLGVDRDAALALEVLAVHHALGDLLIGAERAREAQQRDPRASSCRGRRAR
jgi:hypothetical protein